MKSGCGTMMMMITKLTDSNKYLPLANTLTEPDVIYLWNVGIELDYLCYELKFIIALWVELSLRSDL